MIRFGKMSITSRFARTPRHYLSTILNCTQRRTKITFFNGAVGSAFIGLHVTIRDRFKTANDARIIAIGQTIDVIGVAVFSGSINVVTITSSAIVITYGFGFQ